MLLGGFKSALSSRELFRCCQKPVSSKVGGKRNIIPQEMSQQYKYLALELSITNPIYCSNRQCGEFIPPTRRKRDYVTCKACNIKTCRHCRGAPHSRLDCPADPETQRVRRMARSCGWQECPSCRTVVAKRTGCDQIICRCGAQFCYRCGGYYPCAQSCLLDNTYL